MRAASFSRKGEGKEKGRGKHISMSSSQKKDPAPPKKRVEGVRTKEREEHFSNNLAENHQEPSGSEKFSGGEGEKRPRLRGGILCDKPTKKESFGCNILKSKGQGVNVLLAT